MAGGKLSPRQKMINMMYLVLTAMLALNVSKDILKALTKLEDSLTQTIMTVENKNADVYETFKSAAKENPEKALKWKDKAFEVKVISDELFVYINNLKDSIVFASGGYVDGTFEDGTKIPTALDAKSQPANYLLTEQGPQKATDLKMELEGFRSEIIKIADSDPAIKSSLEGAFSTSDVKEGDKDVTWEYATFGEYPLGAILPFLTDIQARVRNAESEVLSHLGEQIGKGEVSFNTVEPMVMARTNYVTQGGNYEADVFLAAYDDSQDPTIIINGQTLSAEQIVNGKGKITFPANSVGEQTWGGKIIIKQIGQGDIEYDIPQTTYTVAPPSVVISPSKMNVLYRGVPNPIEIGVPGIDPAKIRVSGQGVSGSNGSYTANVSGIKGKEIDITVSVEDTKADGSKSMRTAGSKKFRIKGLPPAVGTIYKRSEGLFSKNAIANATIEAAFQDFPFDLALVVTSYEIAIPGSPPERVKNSNKIPSSVRDKIKKLKPGSTVSIRNIKAKGPNNLKVDRVGIISVDVN
jgi:gliding motility-associated protein GldM